jgi:hypothetical protein
LRLSDGRIEELLWPGIERFGKAIRAIRWDGNDLHSRRPTEDLKNVVDRWISTSFGLDEFGSVVS